MRENRRAAQNNGLIGKTILRQHWAYPTLHFRFPWLSVRLSSNSKIWLSLAVESTTLVTVRVTPSTERISPSNFSKEPVLPAFTFKIKLSSPVT
jgi:hypothetical protein